MSSMNMTTDDLYQLYNDDPDFKRYVDEWVRNHDIDISEIFRFYTLKEYAKWLEEVKK